MDYAVIGVGPAGLQLGWLPERAGRRYVILTSPSPGVAAGEQVEQAVERGGGALDVPGREQVEHRTA
jgi:hypothetical protein